MTPNSPDIFARVSAERVEILRALVAELLRVNALFNLTAVRDFDGAWTKHIEDSLRGLDSELFETQKKVIDIGSGAGFPGLALAVARPDLRITLLDSTRKKCDYIDATAKLLSLNAKALCGRAEEWGQNPVWRERFDVATVRAVGGFAEVCELALPFVKTGGHLVLWRGVAAPEEVKAGANALAALGADAKSVEIRPYELPGHELMYHLITIPKTRRTPREFPRRVGIPKQKPL
ncbi:MAG TPA: 16S rRNA (guanine(527)-N(7))-methyltransferase RsmG [Abditibacteriaceae bacterium]|jgi:16S rRNA (guanine527-N7)-methyltransferase